MTAMAAIETTLPADPRKADGGAVSAFSDNRPSGPSPQAEST